jgi:hypothetical protein
MQSYEQALKLFARWQKAEMDIENVDEVKGPHNVFQWYTDGLDAQQDQHSHWWRSDQQYKSADFCFICRKSPHGQRKYERSNLERLPVHRAQHKELDSF